MDQSNMAGGHDLHFESHSTWNQITNPDFVTIFDFSPDSLYTTTPHDYTPIGTQSYASATTSYSYNSHAVPSSHNDNESQNVVDSPVHNQQQSPIQDYEDQLFMFIDSIVESFEVYNMEAENTHTSHDSVIDRSTPSNSNLGPQVPESSYMNVLNSHLQHGTQGSSFLGPTDSWDEHLFLQEDDGVLIMNLTDQNGATIMLLDEEEMTYEQLLSLEEEMGDISTGLSEDMISRHLKIRTRVSSANDEAPNEEEPEICVICQGEYEKNEKIGTLQCRHEYHEDCIKKWLLQKNVCPICKCTALTREN